MATQTEEKYQLFKVALESYSKDVAELSEQEREEVKRVVVRKMHIEEAVLSSKEATKVVVEKKQIRDAMQQIRQRFDEEGAFTEALKNNALSEDDLYQALVRELHVDAVLDYISTDSKPVSDTDISLFYYMNTAKFHQPEIRKARHILITINDESVENKREASQKKIEQIASRLDKKPVRFEEQALKHSECPTSLQGGLLGDVKRGVLYPELEEALFKMKPGDVSDVVESELGFHLLKCDSIRPATVVPLGDVTDKLKNYLEQRNRKLKQRQWLDSILNKSVDNVELGEIANG